MLNNARIGEGSIIAAGAVIPEGLVIPPRSLVTGVPGRIRRQVLESDYELIQMYARNYLDYSAQYKRRSPFEASTDSPGERPTHPR